MSHARAILSLAAATVALSCGAAPLICAPAQAASLGGAEAAPLSAGTPPGGGTTAASVASRPVVRLLEVPPTASAGRPPRVALRIDEQGVGTVEVRVAVTNLATRKAVIVVDLGWIRTGRPVGVEWPAGVRLRPGHYHVSLTAHDHHSGTLLRAAHSSGVATLTVTAPLGPATPSNPPAPTSTPAGVPSPAQTAADGAVFPVAGAHNFGGPENLFGAPRPGHVHQGQDVLTSEGMPIVAPLAGTILTANYQAGGAGYYAVEETAIGLDFMFAHCKAASLAVDTGQAVTAGQLLCQAGQTGDATTPHVDFEIWVDGWQAPGSYPIDPLPYLEAWEHDGAVG